MCGHVVDKLAATLIKLTGAQDHIVLRNMHSRLNAGSPILALDPKMV